VVVEVEHTAALMVEHLEDQVVAQTLILVEVQEILLQQTPLKEMMVVKHQQEHTVVEEVEQLDQVEALDLQGQEHQMKFQVQM
jgi:hypothetical protein